MNSADVLYYNYSFPGNIIMNQQQILLVQKTWKIFRVIDPQIVGDAFYSKLFTDTPGLRKMFKHPLEGQYKKLVDMLSFVVVRLNNLEEITTDLELLAKRHVGYGVRPAHYKLVGSALLWTLEQGLGQDWTAEIKDAWVCCYNLLSGAMINASGYPKR